MRSHRSLIFGFGLLAAASGSAQNGSVAAPRMGFAFDPTAAAIRPLRGIPGAALLGDPLDAGFAVATAAISPAQNFALAAEAGGSRLRLIPLVAGVEAADLPEGALSAPDQIRFSPSGTAALLYQASGRLQALTGLPDHAAVREIDLSGLSPAPAALAVSDDGALAALAAENAAWTVDADGVVSALALPGSIAALSFRANSHDLAAVSTTGDVHIVRHSESRLLYPGDAQTAAPVGVQLSADGAFTYTANATGTVAAIETATGTLRATSCGCRPAALDPLSRNLYRLTAPGQSVLMVFDGAGEPRVWFVPPDRGARETEGSVQ